MGEWLVLPQAEDMIAARCVNIREVRRGGRMSNRRGSNLKYYDRYAWPGIGAANLDDLEDMDVPMWECEIPLTDDGF